MGLIGSNNNNHHFEMPELETPRLILRKLRIEDVNDIFDYASDPIVDKYVTWDRHETVEDTYVFINDILHRYEEKKPAPWGMYHRDADKIIGTCGFLFVDFLNHRGEIGYALSRKFWGRGLMTEAVREIIRYGFDRAKLNRIEARVYLMNFASQKVLKKVGMEFEGVARQERLIKEKYRDLQHYAILKHEYYC